MIAKNAQLVLLAASVAHSWAVPPTLTKRSPALRSRQLAVNGGTVVERPPSVEERGGGGAGGEGEGGGAGAVVMLTVFTGRLAAPLVPGQRLKLSWRLLLTPVRGAGAPPVADFGTRYFHMQA